MATARLPSDDLEEMRPKDIRNILEQVVDSGITVKSQQRGEPDLTADEKIEILREILHKNPSTFLSRFGRVLSSDNLEYFESFEGDYEVGYRLKELKKYSSKKARETDIKNRRYACLQNMIQNSEYFSEEEIRNRNPLLYEQYVGQYLSQNEKDERDQSQIQTMDKLSLRLLHRWDIEQNEKLLTMQKDFEEGMEQEEEEEEEEEESSGEESDSSLDKKSQKNKEGDSNTISNHSDNIDTMETEWVPNDVERKILHNELNLIMQQRFLNGEDRDFDYSKVDNCEDYDNLTLRSQDEEEAYFDQEEPENVDDLDNSNDHCQ